MLLWRISNHAKLEGRGGLLAPGRWHSEGRPVVYFAESPAGALAEVLVHLELEPTHFPRSFRLLKAEAPDGISLLQVGESDLPSDWQKDSIATRTVGDEWLAAKVSALLRVPSSILPETFNVLLNPEHPDATRVRVLWHREYPWDQRLFR